MSYQSIAKVNDDLSVEHVRVQDTTPIIKSIEEARRHKQTGEMRLAARIPLNVFHQIAAKLGIRNAFGAVKTVSEMDRDELKLIYKELNSNEFKNLRIWEGKL